MSGIRNLTGICHDLRMKFIYRIKCEASECRHSSKWIEYFEQERVVLQEIISGNEAGCDITKMVWGKKKKKPFYKGGVEKEKKKIFKGIKKF